MGDSTDSYDDHPSPKDRIGVLRALTPAYRIEYEESVSQQREETTIEGDTPPPATDNIKGE